MLYDNEQLESFVKGSVLGAMIGDALGFPFSNWKEPPSSVDLIPGPGGEKIGSYQTPATLLLCVLANIVDNQNVELNDLMDKIQDALLAGYLTAGEDNFSDVSPATISAVKNYSNGFPVDKCGNSEEEFNNGECLVRAIPIGLFYATDSLDKIVSASHSVCALTHRHVRSQVASCLCALLTRNIFLQRSEKVFDILFDYYKTMKMNEYYNELEYIKSWPQKNMLSGSNKVEDCFWTSWRSYSNNDNDFAVSVSRSICSSLDSNSSGALTGGFSGLNNGLSEIPRDWLFSVVLNQEVVEIIESFNQIMQNKMS